VAANGRQAATATDRCLPSHRELWNKDKVILKIYLESFEEG
jgi:hypothetical protein